MMDPYEVLGVTRGADEAEIRRRYLELVRQFPPDREPERFKDVRAAYDRLRDPVVRLQSQLFDAETEDSLERIQREVQRRMRRVRIPVAALLSLAEER